jgi:beta-glucosidase
MAKTGFLTGAPRKAGERNTKKHQQIARLIGEESVVLAKNDKGVLPLDAKSVKKILVVGKNAAEKQCHKGCSGEGNVPYEVTFVDGLKARLGKDVEIVLKPIPRAAAKKATKEELEAVARAGGHVEAGAKADDASKAQLDEIKALALASDATIVFTGTELGYDGNMESEGRDRANMLTDPGEDESIAAVLSWNAKNTVVISRAGTPVGYTWTDAAKTMLMSSYLGMEEGSALARVVFGDVNPSGKLCHTWPKRYEDTGVAQMGTYNGKEVVYNERFYVGYRWFDHKGIEPMFPFGHGLSYTRFDVSSVDVEGAKDGGWTVSAKVTNTGKVAGREVVQVYVAYPDAKVERCVKDLRGFAKTKLLAPGESETVRIPIAIRDLAYFDELDHRFVTDEGVYELLVGTSSRNILRKKAVAVGETRF